MQNDTKKSLLEFPSSGGLPSDWPSGVVAPFGKQLYVGPTIYLSVYQKRPFKKHVFSWKKVKGTAVENNS